LVGVAKIVYNRNGMCVGVGDLEIAPIAACPSNKDKFQLVALI
jgi:hypothetical protein